VENPRLKKRSSSHINPLPPLCREGVSPPPVSSPSAFDGGGGLRWGRIGLKPWSFPKCF